MNVPKVSGPLIIVGIAIIFDVAFGHKCIFPRLILLLLLVQRLLESLLQLPVQRSRLLSLQIVLENFHE